MVDRFRAPVLDGEELPRWLFLDMNSYFASVEQQERPKLRGRPVIVVPMMTDSTCAIAASYEAKALGIKTGTNVGEARRLCRDLVLIEARHDVYLDYHYRFVEEIERHLHVTKVCSIDEVACVLMGAERQPENAIRLARAVKAGIAKNVGVALRSSVGLAPTRFLAKVASDLEKPDGLTLLKRADLPGPLLRLKPIDLPGIGVRMNARLAARGLTSMEQLWALSRREMRAAWGGRVGERMWYDLHGFDVPDRPTQKSSIGHSHVIAPDMRAPARARHIARRLLIKAARRLRRDGYCAGGLVLSLRLANHERVAIERRIALTSDSLVLLRHLDDLWTACFPRAPGPHIRKASVVLFHLERGAPPPDLFNWSAGLAEHSARERGERLWRALDTLNTRFGREAVTFASTLTMPKDRGIRIAFSRIPDRAEIYD